MVLDIAVAPGPAPLVEYRAVTKRFGAVIANREVSFAVRRGEVLALVGENGAGKSTVVNVLSGLLRPDAGDVAIDGRTRSFASPANAASAGIGVVHQHFTLVPTLSGLDNVALSLPELGLGRLGREGLRERIRVVADRLGFTVELDRPVGTIDVAAQQRIEIVKALMRDVRLLLLDEPTAVLGPDDKVHLFRTVDRLSDEGVAVLFITHKLEDVVAVANRVVVLRNGAVVADAEASGLTPADIVRHMVGAGDAAAAEAIARGTPVAAHERGAAVCRISGLTLKRANGSLAVSGVDFQIHAGEIVAVAGVDGNGQSELVRCLAGIDRPAAGLVECLGERSDGAGWRPARLRRRGLAHVPEDRRRTGIVAGMTLARNYLLGHLADPALHRFGLIREATLERTVAARLAAFDVRSRGPAERMETLSGGNQQKVVLARELDGELKFLLAAHPSRGLDVKTIRFVHCLLDDCRRAGKAVLLLSSDLDEILALADRVVVFAGGRSVGPAVTAEVGRQGIGGWIAGREDAA